MTKRILIGQLGVYGDCLYATTIARQIKQDNPDCNLTWAIGSSYKNILDNNPYIDIIWEYNVASRLDVTNKWYQFKAEAIARKNRGDFDEIYFTQIYPGNPQMFYGSLRGSMFRVYPHPITVPLDPVLILSPREVERVRQFAEDHALSKKKNVILFECSPQSGQSFISPDFVRNVSTYIVKNFPDTCIILSGNRPVLFHHPNVIDGSTLTFRENAELTKYCTLFIGTGSGITQVCISEWAKPLPMIQLLRKNTVASLIVDHKYFGLPTETIIEMTNCTKTQVVRCIWDCLTIGFTKAREVYNDPPTPDFKIIQYHMRFATATINRKYFDIIPEFIYTCLDYGFDWRVLGFIATVPTSIFTLIKRRLQGVK
jgi:hypothetical protein